MNVRANRRSLFAHTRVALTTLTLVAASIVAAAPNLGCRAMNEDRNNTCVWFPTLFPPTDEEEAARRVNFPEGGDPFVDAEVGPRSFNTRPRGCEFQRSKTADVLGVYPDVDSKKKTTSSSTDADNSSLVAPTTYSDASTSSQNGLNIAPLKP